MGLIFTPVLVRYLLGPLACLDALNGPIGRYNPPMAAYPPSAVHPPPPPTPPLLPTSLYMQSMILQWLQKSCSNPAVLASYYS